MWFSFLFSKTVLRKGCLFSQNIKEQKFYFSFFLHNPKYSDTRNKRKGEGKRAGIRTDHPLDVAVTKTSHLSVSLTFGGEISVKNM